MDFKNAGGALNAFPRDLAKVVSRRWHNMVAGDYVTPPCPPERFLRQLFEMSYLAASTPEEGRYPEFNIVAVPADSHIDIKTLGQVWSFSTPRNATVEEFRRLAPSVDLKKSAILTRWDSKDLTIDGLIDLGTSWSRARLGLQYHYHFPPCLFIQVDRPGRLRTYQGQYLVAALRDGRLERHQGIEFPMSLHAPAHAGLEAIWGDLIHPKLEHVRDYESFAFTAIWNVLASLANCISEDGHGGAFIIVPSESEQNLAELRIKYRQSSPGLRDAFVAFMNARNRTIDYVVRLEGDKRVQRGKHAIAELALAERQNHLVEAIRFVSRLSACDGAIVISHDLRLLGFGAEIKSELAIDTKVRQVDDELRRKYKLLDVEQFGLRHRSAIKLVSQRPKSTVVVISQDGPISVVWSDSANVVTVKRGANLTNLNMIWA